MYFVGQNVMVGDRAKWVSSDATNCDSANDRTVIARVGGNATEGIFHALFHFGEVGSMQLCYRFNFGHMDEERQRLWRVGFILFPGVRAAVYHLDAIMPRATAVDCSTQILVTGVGFSAVVAELPGGASSLRCNFSNEFDVLPVSERAVYAFENGTGAVVDFAASLNLTNSTSLNYSVSSVTVLNDTHLYCATPRAERTGVMPVRLDAGPDGVYTRDHPGGLVFADGGAPFRVYSSDDSLIQSIRLGPGGTHPVGGAYNRPNTLFMTGLFEDYGVPKCRFKSTMADEAGGVWTGGGGQINPYGEFARAWSRPVDPAFWEGGAVVHNTTMATCLKPIFPDVVRPYVNRYEVMFTANGQCYSSVPPIGGSMFYAFNSHVESLLPASLPSVVADPLVASTASARFDTLVISGAGFQYPPLPNSICRFTKLDSNGIEPLVDANGTLASVSSVPAVYRSVLRVECTPPGAGEVGAWRVELLQNGLNADPVWNAGTLTFRRYDASNVSVTAITPPGGPRGTVTTITLSGNGFDSSGDPPELACVLEHPLGTVQLITATRLDAGRVVCELPPLFAQVTDDTPLSSSTAYVSLTLSKSLYDISKYSRYVGLHVVLRARQLSVRFTHVCNSLN